MKKILLFTFFIILTNILFAQKTHNQCFKAEFPMKMEKYRINALLLISGIIVFDTCRSCWAEQAIDSYQVTYKNKSDLVKIIKVNGKRFNSELNNAIEKSKSGDQFFFEKIILLGSNSNIKINNLYYKVP